MDETKRRTIVVSARISPECFADLAKSMYMISLQTTRFVAPRIAICRGLDGVASLNVQEQAYLLKQFPPAKYQGDIALKLGLDEKEMALVRGLKAQLQQLTTPKLTTEHTIVLAICWVSRNTKIRLP